MNFIHFVVSLLFLFVCASHAVNRVTLLHDDRIYLIELLQQTHDDITADGANELVYELENFYTGVRDGLWKECGPPYKIDKAFHLHIINTRFYAAFCETNFGHFVHHSPFWSAHPPPNDLDVRCGDQVKKLRDHDIDVKYEHLWVVPTCGNAAQDKTEPLYEKDRKYHRLVCEL